MLKPMVHYKRIGLTAKTHMDQKAKTLEKVVAVLKKAGVVVYVDRERTDDVPSLKKFPSLERHHDIDAMLTVGGDGTILRAVRNFSGLNVPFITVNKGTLGFLADMTVDQATRALPLLLQGKGCVETRAQIVVSVRRGKTVAYRGIALNEAVIAQGAIARLIELETHVGKDPLTTFHADGLILATPTGSTAYNLAAGGPIVHPHIAAMILTAINPHSFSQKPLVLPGNHTVTVAVDIQERAKDTEVGLSLDGQEYFRLKSGDYVDVTLHEEAVKFLRIAKTSFFKTLRSKLKWGEGPEA